MPFPGEIKQAVSEEERKHLASEMRKKRLQELNKRKD